MGVSDAATIAVDVALCAPTEALADAARALLDATERERVTRFQHRGALRQYLCARWLVRTVLSEHDPRHEPIAWRFIANRWGAPALAPAFADSGLRFNLSHTDGLAAIVVARGVEVGVDVEDTQRRARHAAIAHRFFADAEVAALRALADEGLQRDRFFAYWTLKESYIKARGMGLAIPLGKFAFTVDDPHAISVVTDPSLGDDGARWTFRMTDPTDRHRLAVAVANEGRPVDVRVRWVA